MARPALYVLAGVNGAGKSSIGGHFLTRAGLPWYNPDDFARALVNEYGFDQGEANAQAWQEGVRRLNGALAEELSFAFETTLGGQTIAHLLDKAADTHDVLLWYCGLKSVALHLRRVKARVRRGGHDIPEEKIRERWVSSMGNLIALMPKLAHLRVYDNSRQAVAGAPIQEPVLLLEMAQGRRIYPATLEEAADAPDWAKPALEAAFELDVG